MNASRYALALAIFMAGVLILSYTFLQNSYDNPKPEVDCNEAYDYAMCKRASVPAVLPQPSPIHVYLSVIGTALLALVLIWWSYHSCVIRQEELVVGEKKRQLEGKDAWGHPVPKTIHANDMPQAGDGR